MLAVGLANSVYLWSAVTSKVVKLLENNINDPISAVSYHPTQTQLLAVSTHSGDLTLWDTIKLK